MWSLIGTLIPRANHPKIAVWPHLITQLTKAYKMKIEYFFIYIFCIFFVWFWYLLCIFFASFCFFFMHEYVYHLSNNTNKHLIWINFIFFIYKVVVGRKITIFINILMKLTKLNSIIKEYSGKFFKIFEYFIRV